MKVFFHLMVWNVIRCILVCWRYIPGCSGIHPKWWPWDHGCLESSLKWPCQRWSNPDLCPSSLVLLITPPDAKPSGGSLFRPHVGFFNDFFLCRPRDAERRVSFAPWAASKASTLHFDAFQPLPRHCSCGTGCLIMSTCLAETEESMTPGLIDVDVAWAGNSSRLSLLLAPSSTLRRVGWLRPRSSPDEAGGSFVVLVLVGFVVDTDVNHYLDGQIFSMQKADCWNY